MKRFAAIILLCIHLFNMGGYALMFQYYIHKSDVQMVKQIFDNKIDNKKFVEIKVPVNMPTIQDWTEYEVVQGQIKVQGTYYNYVKLKMTRDTTYFICIANTAKTQLVNAKISTTKEINDIPQNKKGHDAAIKKANTLSDYNLTVFQYNYHAFETQLKPNNKSVILRSNNPFVDSPGKPPDFIS